MSEPSVRVHDGRALQDGCITEPAGCPRGRGDCLPLARYASPGFESFMCCGETNGAPVPSDRLRLCVKSTHEHGVDVLVNLDERDLVHTASVLMAGLSALGSVKITAEDVAPARIAGVAVNGDLKPCPKCGELSKLVTHGGSQCVACVAPSLRDAEAARRQAIS